MRDFCTEAQAMSDNADTTSKVNNKDHPLAWMDDDCDGISDDGYESAGYPPDDC